jgi:hypothetical protein
MLNIIFEILWGCSVGIVIFICVIVAFPLLILFGVLFVIYMLVTLGMYVIEDTFDKLTKRKNE